MLESQLPDLRGTSPNTRQRISDTEPYGRMLSAVLNSTVLQHFLLPKRIRRLTECLSYMEDLFP